MNRPTHLRIEHLDEALSISVIQPRLSWWLPAGTREQIAYRVRAGEWDSGRVDSNRSVLVPYEGPPLVSGQRVTWQVKVWTDAGESDWSEPAWWEMGLLHPSDWVAQWIEPIEEDQVRAQSHRPAYLLRGSFAFNVPVGRARLYVTAHGIYEFFINGRRVGDMELTPGFTSYSSNLQVQTFDVTDLLEHGENVLGAILSDGWFRGQTAAGRLANIFGDSVALLAQLHIYGPDGSLLRVGTGPDWLAAIGSIQGADLFQGQVVDLRRELADWSTPEAALDVWAPVVARDHGLERLCGSPAPPVRRVEEIRPLSVTRPRPDRHVVDLGQNINGWIRLTNLGPAGTTLTLTHGEALAADGDVTLDNITVQLEDAAIIVGQAGWDLERMMLPIQVDRVTSAGNAEASFEPRHTTHGFRYVRIEGHPGDLTVDDINGVVVHSDMRRIGWFECSDERINRLHEAAVWSFRDNACDIPTDCPTRERAGWTGDWQIFAPSAAFVYDVAGFSAKWLRDLAADQRTDGAVPHFIPNTLSMDTPVELFRPGSAGWGDAAVIVPWEMFSAYGDTRVLELQWPSMVAWVDYAARAAREHRHPNRVAARPTPAPHEEFIWDTGIHFGEWLEPGEFDFDLANPAAADRGDVATAYLYLSSRLLGEIASILGRASDAHRYRALAAATKAAWQKEFIHPDGTLTPDKQASYVRALAFDLIPSEQRNQIAQRLVDLIRKADTHLGTGFLATPYLLPVLADAGHLDIAYELLFQDTEPSWLTMIDRGATTIWETWDAIHENGRLHPKKGFHSLNHYSKGAVISFLHRYVGGIWLLEGEPAYRRFRIAPLPGGGITWARAVHDSPYGRIESSWRIEGDRFTLDVTVPPGTKAEILLPDGQRFEADPGATTYHGATSP